MNTISLPFLATNKKQLDTLISMNCSAVEAVIFNKEDLSIVSWTSVWQNIATACKIFHPQNVIFHFPVNNADYVSDTFVYSRLKEAYKRANDLGLKGMVVHSNRIRKFKDWQNISLDDERSKVVERLISVLNITKTSNHTWIGLENMPVMDNNGIEIDPLFCFPSDFKILNDVNIGITWDICHFSNTIANIAEVIAGNQNKKYYPNIQTVKLSDFISLKTKIVHWHFSAFKGVTNPDTDDRCIEGCLPETSTLGENIYKEALNLIKLVSTPNQSITLEIQEQDYLFRKNSVTLIEWLKSNWPANKL